MSAKRETTRYPGIYRRGNRYSFSYRDNRGRQRFGSAATLAEAKAAKSAMQADVARGEYRALSKVTFADYARDWIVTFTGRTERGLREQTRADYRRALGFKLDADGQLVETDGGAVAFFARMRLSEIEPRDVKRYVASVAARGVSANTVRLAVAPVRTMFATAVEEGVIRSNPTTGVRIPVPSSERRKAKALSETELRLLLDELPDEWRLAFEFLAHTGLRIGEALALRWSDLDLGRRRVLVRRRWYRGGFNSPKSEHGERDVPLTEGMARKLWERRKESRAADDALVFGNASGRPLDAANLYNRVYNRRRGGPGCRGRRSILCGTPARRCCSGVA